MVFLMSALIHTNTKSKWWWWESCDEGGGGSNVAVVARSSKRNKSRGRVGPGEKRWPTCRSVTSSAELSRLLNEIRREELSFFRDSLLEQDGDGQALERTPQHGLQAVSKKQGNTFEHHRPSVGVGDDDGDGRSFLSFPSAPDRFSFFIPSK